VLDCILVEPDEWWLGYHRIRSIPSRWPGGIFHLPELPDDMVSRAYVKMREALAWSRLPVKRGDTVAEIGSAPGGASQALLSRGLKVIGIDPAAMDERVLAHPKFTYIQKRGHEVRRREFRGVRWLTADINVAPVYTLDTVEGIVTHPSVTIEGLLLTLKLLEWKLAAEVPAYLERIRSWGFKQVAARQLSHNRQEICVAATQK
jgi:23S rRNA (cytidine2498-2'-O)-methyltransferase